MTGSITNLVDKSQQEIMFSYLGLFTFGRFNPSLDLPSGDQQGLADPSR